MPNGREGQGTEKERFKISDGRSERCRYCYFAAWSACPASARSRPGLLLIPEDAASPRLQRIKDSEQRTPVSRGNRKSRRGRRSRASQSGGPPVGRKRVFIDHVFLKRELRYFRRICGKSALRNARLDLADEPPVPLATAIAWAIERKPFDATTVALKGRSGITETLTQ